MSVAMNVVMGLMSAGGAYFWARNQWLAPDLNADRELFPSRGVPLRYRVKTDVAQTSKRMPEPPRAAAEIVEYSAQPDSADDSLTRAETNQQPVLQAEALRDYVSTPKAPEDSVLRRHYLQQRATEEPVAGEPAGYNAATDQICAAIDPPAIEVVEPMAFASEILPAPLAAVSIPEDSVLRRHVLTQIRTEIESGLPPQPADATLKRHHAQLLQSKLADRLN